MDWIKLLNYPKKPYLTWNSYRKRTFYPNFTKISLWILDWSCMELLKLLRLWNLEVLNSWLFLKILILLELLLEIRKLIMKLGRLLNPIKWMIKVFIRMVMYCAILLRVNLWLTGLLRTTENLDAVWALLVIRVLKGSSLWKDFPELEGSWDIKLILSIWPRLMLRNGKMMMMTLSDCFL